MLDVIETIRRFNAGRDPQRLAMKYRALRTSPFSFLRGTCHLFYERLPSEPLLREAPPAWSCGDLHLENFGSYKGDDRLVYFDVNDFDEAALAPLTWDGVRFLTSVLLAADTLHATPNDALRLCRTFTEAYANALTAGKARRVGRDSAGGLIGELLESLRARKRSDLLDRYTEKRPHDRRGIRLDGKHAVAVSDADRARVTRLIDHCVLQQPRPGFFKVLDLACRVAGTGSLGVERYLVLVEGKGSPDGNYLLDLKQAMPSSLESHLKIEQPTWPSQAHRVVELQRRMQAVSMAFLQPVVAKASSYVLRGLQPSEDRVALQRPGTNVDEIGGVLAEMGRIVAWDQLRSSGRQRSATADELMAFGASREKWADDLIDVAQQCAHQVVQDWTTYAAAFDAGAFAR